MKKFLYILTCCMLIICCSVAFMGCDIIQGKSAYDIAVDNGFEGTVEEWLESLKGADGKNGENGKDGANGKNGVDGEDVSIKEIFELAVEFGLYTNDSAGYNKFLSDYFSKNLDAGEDVISEVSNRCLNNVVSIYCENSTGDLQCGAGVIYEINTAKNIAYVITNYHVISCSSIVNQEVIYEESKTICLYLYGTESLEVDDYDNLLSYGDNAIMAEYIGGSADYDLAMLKVSGENFEKLNNGNAKSITFADGDNIALGSTAIAIGNPMGGGTAVCEGVISVDSEYITISIAGSTRVLRCMRISTPINGGNSGGGLFNLQGELIGICNAKMVEYVTNDGSGNLVVESYENVSYALPSANVKNVVENIIDFYEANYNENEEDNTVGVHKYLIGITITSENLRNVYDKTNNTNTLYEDIVISEVNKTGIAYNNLLEGDKIVSIVVSDGVNEDEVFNLKRRFELLDNMLTIRAGETVTINVLRENEQGQTEEKSFTFVVDVDGYTEYKGAGI